VNSQSPNSQELMRRALDLAAGGRGWVEPNPVVGCVIVLEGRIVGEGWHKRFGGPHAEREAIAACIQSPASATAYVTLEPCCHANKKTPPCVPALIEAGISRVMIACADPNPQVCGKGAQQLRAAGISVEIGLLERAAKQLNAAYFKRMLHKRPYVTLKWAQTADGKVAGEGGRRTQISDPRSMRVVHELRGRCDAILVGINTVLSDDPLLTAREVVPARRALRAVLDSSLRLPTEAQLARSADQGPVVAYCAQEVIGRRVLPGGVECVAIDTEASGRLSLSQVLDDLYARGATHVLVEPGPKLARSFLEQNLADRLWIFHSPNRLDHPTAPSAPLVDWPVSAQADLDGDRLIEMLNPRGPAFYELLPGADFPR